MKLLLDSNLSTRLLSQPASRLAELFPGSAHIEALGLAEAPDTALWAYARSNHFALLTADSDFFELATTLGAPPKIIWLRGCDYPTTAAQEILLAQQGRITQFLDDPEQAVLIVQPWRPLFMHETKPA